MEPLVSVIIPVYNNQRELHTCVDSILAQTFRDLELILVDDGSQDDSGRIADDYAARDSRVHVIHQKNSGAGAARNAGLRCAKGTYFAFVDGDDWVKPQWLMKMYSYLTGHGLKIVACNYNICLGAEEKAYADSVENRIFSTEEAITSMWYGEEMDTNVWTRLYHRSIWEGIWFPEIFAEDLAVVHHLLEKTDRCGYIAEPLYQYRLRESSETRSFSERKFAALDTADEIMRYAKDSSMDLVKPARNKAVDTYFHVLCRMDKGQENRDIYQRCKHFIVSNRRLALKDKRLRKKTQYALLLSYLGMSTVRSVFRKRMR